MTDDRTTYTKKIIPKQVWREARAEAIKEDKTITEWITEAIEEKLNKNKEKE